VIDEMPRFLKPVCNVGQKTSIGNEERADFGFHLPFDMVAEIGMRVCFSTRLSPRSTRFTASGS